MYINVKAEYVNGTFDTLTTSRLVIWTTAVVERRIRKKVLLQDSWERYLLAPPKFSFLYLPQPWVVALKG